MRLTLDPATYAAISKGAVCKRDDVARPNVSTIGKRQSVGKDASRPYQKNGVALRGITSIRTCLNGVASVRTSLYRVASVRTSLNGVASVKTFLDHDERSS